MCRINCNLHLLVGILLSSVGVTFAGGDLPDHLPPSPSRALIKKRLAQDMLALSRYSVLKCSGNLRVKLATEIERSNLNRVLKPQHARVNVSQHDDVLVLSGEADKRYRHDVIVYTDAASLRVLQTSDSCAVVGRGLKAKTMALLSYGSGNISLQGEFDSYRIEQNAANNIDLYWLNAKEIDVFAHAGKLRLAGEVEHLRVQASGNAQLHLLGLRARQTWLRAVEDSKVALFGARHFVAFLQNDAQVKVYGQPLFSNSMSLDNSMLVYQDYPLA